MSCLILIWIDKKEFRCVVTKEEYKKFKEEYMSWDHMMYELTPTHTIDQLKEAVSDELKDYLKNKYNLIQSQKEYEHDKNLLEKERRKLDQEIEKYKNDKYKFIKGKDSDSDSESESPKKEVPKKKVKGKK